MAERFLIDTSAVIKYLNGSFSREGLSFMDNILRDGSSISFISEIELQAWNPSNPDDLSVYKEFVQSSNVIRVNDMIIQQTIEIRKLKKLKLPDALIAATALVNDMILIADNDSDFKRVTNLKYKNPMDLIGS